MGEERSFVLSYQPNGRAVVRDFFNAYGKVQRLLLDPPETRLGSFGLRMAATPILENAEYWELRREDALTGRVRRLRVYIDGSVIFRASADGSFLCWPPSTTGNVVNPVVVADSIVSFCRFVGALLALMTIRPDTGRLGVEIRNGGGSEPQLMMYPGRLRRDMELFVLDPQDMHCVGEISPREEVAVFSERVLPGSGEEAHVGADATAFEVVAKFYRMFGFDIADIPYVDRSGDRPVIDIRAFGE